MRMDYLQVWMTVCLSSASLVVSVGSILLSLWASKKYGDLAGTAKMISYQQRMADRRRDSALGALVNELNRIKRILLHNSGSKDKQDAVVTVLRLPVAVFEAAFFSPDSPLLDDLATQSPELLGCVWDYLIKADHINALVDLHQESASLGDQNHPMARTSRTAERQATDKSKELLDSLDQLEEALMQAQQSLERNPAVA